MILLYILSFITPGYWHQGPPLRDGRKVKFYCNGLSSLLVMTAIYGVTCYQGWMRSTLAYDEFGGFLSLALLSSLAVSFYLFVRGRAKGLASGEGFIHDFVMGQELVRSLNDIIVFHLV